MIGSCALLNSHSEARPRTHQHGERGRDGARRGGEDFWRACRVRARGAADGRDARRRIEHETYMYRFMRYVYCHEGSDSERSAHECQWITTYRSELHSCMCFAIERRCVCGSLRVEVCGGLHDGGTQGWVSFGVHTPQKRWVCVRINSKAPCTCAHICI